MRGYFSGLAEFLSWSNRAMIVVRSGWARVRAWSGPWWAAWCTCGLLVSSARASEPQALQDGLEDYVQAALQAEADGDLLRRQQMLASARACQPDAPELRWNTGCVQSAGGDWLDIEQCIQRLDEQSPLLETYEHMRSAAVDSLASHWRLATWCRQNGLLPQARAHFERVIDLDSDHWGARQALGYQLLAGEWVGPEAIDAIVRRAQQTSAAIERYGSELQQLARGLASPQANEVEVARQQLFQMNDPACVLAAQSLLNGAEADLASTLIAWLGSLESVESTEALLQYAVVHPEEALRKQATKLLTERPVFDFVPKLLQSISSPIGMMAVPAFNRDGTLAGYRQVFSKQSQDRHEMFTINTDVQRVAVPLLVGAPSSQDAEGNWTLVSPRNMPENGRVERQLQQATSAEVAWRLEAVQKQNWVNQSFNERAAHLLSAVAGEEIPSNATDMWQWWDDTNEVEYQKYKPGRYREQRVRRDIPLFVGVSYEEGPSAQSLGGGLESPPSNRFSWGSLVGVQRPGGECFAAGTPVLTSRGFRPIESVRAGDLVFARHTPTGALVIKPVLRGTERPPAATVLIDVGGEQLQCTRGHLFWVAGSGWKKASEIQPGDVLHAAEQPAIVVDVQEAGRQVTYNLEVADCSTYFVGKSALLSHDVTPRRACKQTVPGLALLVNAP